VARKPLIGTVAANVQQHGTGALNIDGCRIEGAKASGSGQPPLKFSGQNHRPFHDAATPREFDQSLGRWPANLIHDGSEEVVALFPETTSGTFNGQRSADKFRNTYSTFKGTPEGEGRYEGSTGSAARFFYCAKVSPSERGDSTHPTMKPVALMRYLCRLVTPPGGRILEPFAGSGSTIVAALEDGFNVVACDLEPENVAHILKRTANITPGLGL
jgi:site-specific DNA-methyltransferase (adenine-specific)